MRQALVEAGHEPESAEIERVPYDDGGAGGEGRAADAAAARPAGGPGRRAAGLLQRRLPGRSARCVRGLRCVLTAPVTAPSEPIVLGIDPGLRICGWGVVRGGSRAATWRAARSGRDVKDTFAQRLLVLHQGIEKLIEDYAPAEVAIEDPFVGALQPASALAIGQARAAAVLAAAAAGHRGRVLRAGGGEGRGLRLRAGRQAPGAGDGAHAARRWTRRRSPLDAADALAVAICHLNSRRARALERAARR